MGLWHAYMWFTPKCLFHFSLLLLLISHIDCPMSTASFNIKLVGAHWEYSWLIGSICSGDEWHYTLIQHMHELRLEIGYCWIHVIYYFCYSAVLYLRLVIYCHYTIVVWCMLKLIEVDLLTIHIHSHSISSSLLDLTFNKALVTNIFRKRYLLVF